MNKMGKAIERILSGSLMIAVLATAASAQQAMTDQSRFRGTVRVCAMVLGGVRQPGRLELQPGVRLSELIAKAGGLAENAGATVQVLHSEFLRCPDSERSLSESAVPGTAGDSAPVFALAEILKGEEKSNPQLQDGDVVVVMELEVAYVTGAVVSPKTVYLSKRITLSQAIAMAGGVTRDGRSDKVRIYRLLPGSSERVQINVSLKAIIKHRADDSVLEPYDVIEVTEKHGRHRETNQPRCVFW